MVGFCFHKRWVSLPVVILSTAYFGQAHIQVAKAAATSQTSKPAQKKPAVRKTSSLHPVAHTSRRRSTRSRSTAPSYQLHPDPERYQQIQQALADKGYFKGEINGTWGNDSEDALKRFQVDQKLPDDGKINALTLTGLGLGPKHDGSSIASSTAAAPSVPLLEPPPTLQPSQGPPK